MSEQRVRCPACEGRVRLPHEGGYHHKPVTEQQPSPEQIEALDGLATHAVGEYQAGRTRSLREIVASKRLANLEQRYNGLWKEYEEMRERAFGAEQRELQYRNRAEQAEAALQALTDERDLLANLRELIPDADQLYWCAQNAIEALEHSPIRESVRDGMLREAKALLALSKKIRTTVAAPTPPSGQEAAR